jgi:hypothetical protein
VLNTSLNQTADQRNISKEFADLGEEATTDYTNLIDNFFAQMTSGELSNAANCSSPEKAAAKQKAREEFTGEDRFHELYQIIPEDYTTSANKIPSYNYWDRIGLHTIGKGLINEIPIYDLERSTFDRIMTPGIDRYKMPEIPQMSSKLRKLEMSKITPFVSCDEPELKRRLILKSFEGMMKEKFPTRDWSFKDRNYLEKFDAYNFKHVMNSLT